MNKQEVYNILEIAKNLLENIDEDNQGAKYYLKEIIENAENILYSGY